jgi:hypothetical protein
MVSTGIIDECIIVWKCKKHPTNTDMDNFDYPLDNIDLLSTVPS